MSASARPLVIGLTGPNSSGKGVTSDYLATRHGFFARSLSDVVREEARRRGLEPVRDVIIPLGTELRRAQGAGVLARMAMQGLPPRALIDSIRNPEEVAVLRTLPRFHLVSVDASLSLRFDRSRARCRPGDPETLEGFMQREERENTSDPAAQQLRATAALADDHLVNDGSLEDLHAAIDSLVERLERGA